MHVVDATLFFSPTSGGVKRYLCAKHEWMRRHTRWRHSLVVPGEIQVHAPGDVSMVRGGRVPGAFNYRLPLNPVRWARAIDALEPDVIEVGDAFHPAWAAANVANKRGIPLIAFYHSNFPELAGRRLGRAVQRFIEWYVRLTYERCEQVLAPSRYMVEYLHGIGVHHASCQPLGVDVDAFSPARRRRNHAAELKLPPETRVFAFAGRFSAEKNIPVLIEAFRLLGAPYHLLLIGGGESGVEGNVTRIPYCGDDTALAGFIASSRAFVHAGSHETFGLVLLEAMACGRPVVAMRASAVPELVPRDAGMLVEPHDDLAIAARRFADGVLALEEQGADGMGAAARKHVETHYSWSRAFPSLMARYQTAVSLRRAPLAGEEMVETSTQ